MTISGFLNIDKPPHLTSFDVVRAVKRATGEKHVGHGGTLDPLATGVLPICMGHATRLMESLVASSKAYRAEILLGVTTDTYDADGTVVATADPSLVTKERVLETLSRFVGRITQVPPIYSAIRMHGQRLYELARSGTPVTPEPRQVQVFRLDLTAWRPPSLVIEAECAGGAYVRSLAHDIGQVLGCGAHITALVRLRTGPFAIEEAKPLYQVIEAARQGTWQSLLYPTDFPVQDLPAIIASDAMEKAVAHGQKVTLAKGAGYRAERLRLYSLGGEFRAILARAPLPGQWQPYKVFLPEET